MGFPYSWVIRRCANNGRIYTIPIPIPVAHSVFGLGQNIVDKEVDSTAIRCLTHKLPVVIIRNFICLSTILKILSFCVARLNKMSLL